MRTQNEREYTDKRFTIQNISNFKFFFSFSFLNIDSDLNLILNNKHLTRKHKIDITALLQDTIWEKKKKFARATYAT